VTGHAVRSHPKGGRGESKTGGRLLTADEVAEMLGVSKEWVWEQSRLGLIPTITLGRFRRYRKEAVERWLLSIEDGTI
jgi:excisionase family DNA binding protein